MKLDSVWPLPLMLVASVNAAPAGVTRAVAVLASTQGSSAGGRVTFSSVDGKVRVLAEMRGLSPGGHGLHIHEFGDCSSPDGASAGAHFNPTGDPHGGPADSRKHLGDLGNVEASEDGVGRLDIETKLSLDGPTGILGRSIVVHTQPDDFKTQPAGNTGRRLACGVIGVARSEVSVAPATP